MHHAVPQKFRFLILITRKRSGPRWEPMGTEFFQFWESGLSCSSFNFRRYPRILPSRDRIRWSDAGKEKPERPPQKLTYSDFDGLYVYKRKRRVLVTEKEPSVPGEKRIRLPIEIRLTWKKKNCKSGRLMVKWHFRRIRWKAEESRQCRPFWIDFGEWIIEEDANLCRNWWSHSNIKSKREMPDTKQPKILRKQTEIPVPPPSPPRSSRTSGATSDAHYPNSRTVPETHLPPYFRWWCQLQTSSGIETYLKRKKNHISTYYLK